jgi:aspartate aminotransferase
MACRTTIPNQLEALAAVARKYRILVVSDEIYSELHHAGSHLSLSKYYPEGTIVSGGLSKWCGAGGWRMGFWLFPPSMGWLRSSMLVMASETYTSVASPIQYAARRAFVLEYVRAIPPYPRAGNASNSLTCPSVLVCCLVAL